MYRFTRKFVAMSVAVVCLGVTAGAQAANVAASANGGVASQSSDDSGGLASRANDGNTNGNFLAGSVSHTSNDPSPFAFWEVLLGGGDNAIDKIIVYNRTDAVPGRIDPFRLTLFDGAAVAFSQDVPDGGFAPDIVAPNVSGMTFDLTGQVGDRVRVQLLAQDYLHMAKVEVFPGLPGDYNNDGKVAAADYVVWRKNDGMNTTLPNDPIGPPIDQDQYNQWAQNFGNSNPGSGSAPTAAVPEPTAVSLLFTGVLALFSIHVLKRNHCDLNDSR